MGGTEVDWFWVFVGIAIGLTFAALVIMATDWLGCRTVERECDE
jgi:hypothetical protein